MRVDVTDFDRRYRADEDPWQFASSRYEQFRYDSIVGAVGGRTYQRAFEPGCSIGVLTARLASIADRVVAVDASPAAISVAAERLGGLDNVDLHVGVVPEWWPDGDFDLVVFSELGYYWDLPGLDDVVSRVGRLLRPGGVLVAVHWLGSSPDHLLSGHTVHARLRHRFGPSTSRVERGRSSHDADGATADRFVIERWDVT
jgi:SAM-dependent methyltransferase